MREVRSGMPGVFQSFVRTEAASGLVLLAAAFAALVAANSPWAGAYHDIWTTTVMVGPKAHVLSLTVHQWINDALMAVFFLLVGLEIKREFLVGELATLRQAALPLVSAVGGMLVPAAIYLLLAGEGAARGWAIPTATDIAFALGVLALVAPNAPSGLKVFLAALAIVDDMGAVVVIAVFYTSAIVWPYLAASVGVLCLLLMLNRLGVRRLAPYLTLGALLWACVHASGIHATIAGVLLAFTIPTRTRINAKEFSERARALLDEFDRTETGDLRVITSKGQQEALQALEAASEAVVAPLLRLEHGLHHFTAWVVMPLFAFANAGVSVIGHGEFALPTVIAVGSGLAIGKPLGITGAAYLAWRAGFVSLPAGVTWRLVHGAAWIAGIGFTMSLFIAGLAFEGTPPFDAAKVGILAGSLVAAAVGATILRREDVTARRAPV